MVFRFEGLAPLTAPHVKELFNGKNLVVEISLVQDRVEGNLMMRFDWALITFLDEKLRIRLLVLFTVFVSKVILFVISFVGNKEIKLLELAKLEE